MFFLKLTVCSTFSGYLIWHKYIAVLTPTLGESTEESDIIFLVQKTIVSVELRCSKCRQKVMKLIATIEGITSIVLDPSKKTVTVIGRDSECYI